VQAILISAKLCNQISEKNFIT